MLVSVLIRLWLIKPFEPHAHVNEYLGHDVAVSGHNLHLLLIRNVMIVKILQYI
jgi:hypothetical protein